MPCLSLKQGPGRLCREGESREGGQICVHTLVGGLFRGGGEALGQGEGPQAPEPAGSSA